MGSFLDRFVRTTRDLMGSWFCAGLRGVQEEGVGAARGRFPSNERLQAVSMLDMVSPWKFSQFGLWIRRIVVRTPSFEVGTHVSLALLSMILLVVSTFGELLQNTTILMP